MLRLANCVIRLCLRPINSKGISQSALPYRRTVPSWLKLNAEDVKEQIKKLGKKGMTPSQIGEYTRPQPMRPPYINIATV